VFFRFAGGKGVATAAGVLLGLNAWLGLATLLIWLATAVLFRYSSLASIVSALLAPAVYALGGGNAWYVSKSIAFSVVLMSLLLLYRHAENINRLVKGTESKIGKKPHHCRPLRCRSNPIGMLNSTDTKTIHTANTSHETLYS
jgi:glycerol-3-phosphate acyltransferase PlsY